METKTPFEIIVQKWQASSHLADAILEDYTNEMSKLTGVDKKVIRTRIINDTNERLLKAKGELVTEKTAE